MPELKMFGITDRLLEHGTPKELQHECGYDVAVIKRDSTGYDKRENFYFSFSLNIAPFK
jgi:hypothetical protein